MSVGDLAKTSVCVMRRSLKFEARVGLLECRKEQDPKVFRYVGVCGVRTGERHVRRGGRRKERRLVEAGSERGDSGVSRRIRRFVCGRGGWRRRRLKRDRDGRRRR